MTTSYTVAPPVYDEAKFTELLLYVASRLAGDKSNGSVKLNKVLFFSDFLFYSQTGKSITGAQYTKQPLGPAPRGIVQLQERLISTGQANMAVVTHGARAQKMLFATREPDLSRFTADEISLVERIIGVFSDSSAQMISDVSHEFPAWKVAREKEVIPYEAIHIYDGPITEDDVTHAETIAEELQEELSAAGLPG